MSCIHAGGGHHHAELGLQRAKLCVLEPQQSGLTVLI